LGTTEAQIGNIIDSWFVQVGSFALGSQSAALPAP
jgi:hypothetical protein